MERRKLLPRTSTETVELSVTPLQKQRQGSRYFEFFRAKTGQNLSAILDVNFWNRILLQIGQSEPTVWHAIIALSSLDEQCMTALGTENAPMTARRDALVHYNKAVGRLTTAVAEKKASIEVILVTCLLFVCIELLLENVPGAMAHVQGGVKILENWKSETERGISSKTEIVEDDLLPIFLRLQLQMGTFSTPSRERAPKRLSEKPTEIYEFLTFKEARDSMVDLYQDALGLANSLAAGLTEDLYSKGLSLMIPTLEYHRLMSRADFWKRTFENMLSRADMLELNEESSRMADILIIQYTLVSNYIKVGLSPLYFTSEPPEDVWDPYNKDYEAVLELAEREAAYYDASQGDRAFALELGIILPLYTTILQCREPSIRQRALSILYSSPRKEGFWDSRIAAEMAKTVIELGDASGQLGVLDLPRRPRSARFTYSERVKEIQNNSETPQF